MAANASFETDIVVVGAGPAGLMAAAAAATKCRVVLLEKNSKSGVKILMSGGTRCNLTQDTHARGISESFGQARRFLQPSVGAFDPSDTIAMFHRLGVPTKREPTGKIFPQSDRAVHVRDALHRQAVDAGVDLRLKTAVHGVESWENGWSMLLDHGRLTTKRVIITSGGQSYPGCGTVGEGYSWLRKLGHTVVPTHPALVPLTGDTTWMRELSGITLDRVTAEVHGSANGGPKRRPVIRRQAAWLFTHFGYSGPAAMDVSRHLTGPGGQAGNRLTIDLLPTVSGEELDGRLSQRGGGVGRRRVSSVIGEYLPTRLASAVTAQLGRDHTLSELPVKHRRQLVACVKRLPIPVTGSRGFAKAEVTAGGIALNEVNPRTMESRLHAGLYLAGEILDVDGWIGGYNFQAAFATGRAAGLAASGTLV